MRIFFVVHGNPMSNIKDIRNTMYVMKNGKLLVDNSTNS